MDAAIREYISDNVLMGLTIDEALDENARKDIASQMEQAAKWNKMLSAAAAWEATAEMSPEFQSILEGLRSRPLNEADTRAALITVLRARIDEAAAEAERLGLRRERASILGGVRAGEIEKLSLKERRERFKELVLKMQAREEET